MFDHHESGIGLLDLIGPNGESSAQAEDQIAYEVTCLEMADGWLEPDRHVLPDDLEDLPLTFLAVLVRSVDRGHLNGYDAVRLLQAEARLESSFAASKLATTAEVAHCPPGDPGSPVERSTDEIQYAADEIAPALTLTRRAAESQLDHALALSGPLRRVWTRLADGGLSFHKVREFIRTLAHHDQSLIDDVLDRCLDAASDLTTGQLRARLHRLVLEADPAGLAHSMDEGLKDRKVVSYQNPDLTGSIGVLSSHPNDVAAALSNIDRIARSLKTENEPRSLDQIKNDVAIDLLKGTQFVASGGGGRVNVTIPAATLERWADLPGELDGFGPVTAEIARKTAMENLDGEWVYQVADNGRSSPRERWRAVPPRPRNAGSVPTIRPVSFLVAVSRLIGAISTTASPSHRVGRLTTTTSVRSVATTIWCVTMLRGYSLVSRMAITCGPAHSVRTTSGREPRPTSSESGDCS